MEAGDATLALHIPQAHRLIVAPGDDLSGVRAK